jgi:HEAT repeats/PBS lyase HEAT-like repeat
MRIMRTPGPGTYIRIILTVLASSLLMSVFGQQGRQKSPATEELMRQFTSEKVFWKQFEIAKKIVQYGDTSGLGDLAEWLKDDDRHLRGNVAFVFARLGDERGFPVIAAILKDRSDRPEGQGQGWGSSDGRYHVAQQIRADRYYAVILLGHLKDPRAVPILVPLLRDSEVNYAVPWALGEIGDPRADGPLIGVLGDDDPSIRVFAIQALEKLGAREALPRLRTLLNDSEKSRLGNPVSVAETARAAIIELERKP